MVLMAKRPKGRKATAEEPYINTITIVFALHRRFFAARLGLLLIA